MRLLIDLQGCQTASRHRGIGRYSLALANALVRNRGSHEIFLLANGAFPETLSHLRANFVEQVGESNFIVFDADLPVAEFEPGNALRARLAELARERLIKTLAPDAVLLTSLFEGFVDDAITSIGRLGKGPLTAVTLYDLIPYVNPDPNWPPEYGPYYARKISSLRQADLLLSISAYAKDEAVQAIPELSDRIVNISSACDRRFTPDSVDEARQRDLFQRLGIDRPFVMSAGILEPRKNFDLLVRAFGKLPEERRRRRQIVLAGGGEARTIEGLKHLAHSLGIDNRQLVITGHVSDDDLVDLYRLCDLFVFPSRHEGFGLPPLEAMSCGAAVIASNATSIPEVVGRNDALFDPTSVDALAGLMKKSLKDQGFRDSLKASGLLRAREFSWDRTAACALNAIAEAVQRRDLSIESSINLDKDSKPKLAIVCPLPPEQTGIADYQAELLPELSSVYDITVVSNQSTVNPLSSGLTPKVRPVSWFEENAECFGNRIVYHIGNSPFHARMPDLLARFPGVVVLHDFYLSALTSWMEKSLFQQNAFRDYLLFSHGYVALQQLKAKGIESTKIDFPTSFEVVQRALGIIVNSKYAKIKISEYYGERYASKVFVTRLQRVLPTKTDRSTARARLGIAEHEFLVCAFGFMDHTKLNHRLIEAWTHSTLSTDHNCRLVFVGGKAYPEYADRIDNLIDRLPIRSQASITGFADRSKFEDYLAAANVAVQLRAMSRGETSGTVLDCLAYGLPVIINENGPMAEYPSDILVKLPDDFETPDLVRALESLRNDASLRKLYSARGPVYISEQHSPSFTVASYFDAIEQVASDARCVEISQTTQKFWGLLPQQSLPERYRVANIIADAQDGAHRPTIYLDISATCRNDLRTGIERVARALLKELLAAQPNGYLVAPVYLTEEHGHWRVRRANKYLAQQEGFGLVPNEDALVLPGPGDILMALDLFPDGVIPAAAQGLYDYWRAAGAKIGFTVFDLLPISHPEFFPSWAPAGHERWMKAVCHASDLLVCISNHVANEVRKWMSEHEVQPERRLEIAVSHLGADVDASAPTAGLPATAPLILDTLLRRPSFLMVGTVEPRKGHLLVLKAFAELWERGVDVNLVIVGHEGWKSLPNEERRTIPAIVHMINSSPELGKRLFWLAGISDEYLEKIYSHSRCLIAASEDEGFGLPLIEAAHHSVPVLARDIAVFREVAGGHAHYFDVNTPTELADAILGWLNLYDDGQQPSSAGLRWLTWKQSATQLIAAMNLSASTTRIKTTPERL